MQSDEGLGTKRGSEDDPDVFEDLGGESQVDEVDLSGRVVGVPDGKT